MIPDVVISVVWSLLLIDVKGVSGRASNVAASAQASYDSLITYLSLHDCDQVHCSGLDCFASSTDRPCQVCACPIGSPARGCDRMPKTMRHHLFEHGCPFPNGTSAPSVRARRWYRKINRKTGKDECRHYLFPVCPEAQDFNLWRSPVTKEECLYYCYPESDPIIRNQLQVEPYWKFTTPEPEPEPELKATTAEIESTTTSNTGFLVETDFTRFELTPLNDGIFGFSLSEGTTTIATVQSAGVPERSPDSIIVASEQLSESFRDSPSEVGPPTINPTFFTKADEESASWFNLEKNLQKTDGGSFLGVVNPLEVRTWKPVGFLEKVDDGLKKRVTTKQWTVGANEPGFTSSVINRFMVKAAKSKQFFSSNPQKKGPFHVNEISDVRKSKSFESLPQLKENPGSVSAVPKVLSIDIVA